MLCWFKKLVVKVVHTTPRVRFKTVNGYKFYCDTDRLHNEYYPAVITPEGIKFWYLDNKLFRRDGPSIESPDGSQYWVDGDNLHRTDGPAVEHANGAKIFYLNNREMTFEQWMKQTTISKERKVELALIYS